jgi:uncharacterized repeat protein (TIGR01451 family)
MPRSLLLCALFAVFIPAVLSAQPAFLVKDINTSTDYPPAGFWPEFAQANGLLFFFTDDGIHGSEMWRSDGTEAGTFLVADACPGICDNLSGGARLPTAVGGNVYFTVTSKLWQSDGTVAGTAVVQDLQRDFLVSDMAALNGKLIFSASQGGAGDEPFVSDGTAAGTVQLADIWPGTQGSYPIFLGQAGGNLFFSAADPVHGRELWKTDGTPAGTALVKDLDGGSGDSFTPYTTIYREGFASVGNRLFFRSGGIFLPEALWVTDGTTAGTVRINDLVPGNGWTEVRGLTARSGDIVFQARVGNTQEMWRTDGTTGGTVRLKSGDPYDSMVTGPDFANLGGTVFFAADGLWKTDGTPAGTMQVSSVGTSPILLKPVGTKLLFFGADASHSLEPWKSDGTGAGTLLLKDVNPGPSSSFGPSPRYDRGLVVGGRWFFGATDGTTWGLWVSDGTAAGTQLVRRFPAQRSSVGPEPGVYHSFLPVGDFPGARLFFSARDGQVNPDLWTSDGTLAGTQRIEPPSLGGPVFSPNLFTSLGDRTLFTSGGLWRTDGTAGGTFKIPGAPTGAENLVRAGSQAFFRSYTGGLWKTDGTGAAVRVQDTTPDSYTLTAFGDRVLYVYGDSVWISDGTPGGAQQVLGSEAYSYPDDLIAAGDRFFFSAVSSGFGRELWVGDATAAAHRVTDLVAGPGDSVYRYSSPVALHGSVLFQATDGAAGFGLWVSDGTAAGTVRLASSSSVLAAGRDKAWFILSGVQGSDLWVTDGTPAGTHMLRHIAPGGADAFYPELRPVGQMLLFSGFDDAHGLELWRSDGTAAGTALLQDIAPGPAPSSPQGFTVTDSYVFFAANDTVTGFEPWALPRTALGPFLRAAKTVAGQGSEGGTVTYTIMISNTGIGPSTDNPGDEMTDALPAGLTLLDASADTGTAAVDLPANRVTWNGALPAGGTATVTIHARVGGGMFPGVILNQATLSFDADDNGTNESAGVSDGPSAGAPTPLNVSLAAVDFYTAAPCRVVDTRSSSPLSSGVARTFTVAGSCGIPANAKAVAANVTVVTPTGSGYVSIYPAGTLPGTSTVNFQAGQVRAGNAVLALKNGAVDAKATVGGSGTVQVVIDVSGYFE